MAGLVAALGPDKVLGIDTGAMPDPLPAVARFAAEAGEEPVDSGARRARFDQVGSGYGDLALRGGLSRATGLSCPRRATKTPTPE